MMSSKVINDFPVKRELQRFSSIVAKHNKELETIKEALDPVSQQSWQKCYDVLSLKLNPYEFVSDFELICTENEMVNKTTIALTALCKEMSNLAEEAEHEFYVPLSLYGEEYSKDKEITVIPELKFSKVLPLLHQICNFVQHVKKVIVNASHQLNILHSSDKKNADIHAGTAHFQVVFEYIGRVLGSLIIIDEIIKENTLLREHCVLYKRLLKTASSDVSSFSSNKQDLNNLKNFVHEIETQIIISGSTLKNILTEMIVSRPSYASNGCLRNEVLTVILGWASRVEGTGGENWLWDYKDQVLNLTALSIYYCIIFDSQEKKIAKTLVSLYKKVPCVTIAFNHVWIGEEYIKSHFPSIHSVLDRKQLEGLSSFRKQYLTSKVQSLASDAEAANVKVINWSTRMDAAKQKPANVITKQDLNQRASVFWHGFVLASQLKEIAESVLGLHTLLGQPMGKACAVSLCRIVEALKAIEETYHRNISLLAETLPHLRQYLSFQVLLLVKHTKDRVEKERKLNKHLLDVLSSLSIAEQALAGNGNAHRLLIARVALSLANQDRIINDEDLTNLLSILRRLNIASDIQGKIKTVTNTAFLYRHQILFKIYLQDFFDNLNTTQVHRLHYMLSAVNDSEYLLRRPKHFDYREVHLNHLYDETNALLKQELLDKLCEKIETELRLQSHSHLQVNRENPFETPIKLLEPLINLPPLQLFGSFINIKDYVEVYLQKMFYNLTVLAPHNGTTYERMRNLAKTNFNLITIDSHLPSQTLEQGVDVLEIMRNINIFVQNYRYNLNQQFFIEIESNNKHLNTVSIKHIANSIRTHGMGIINTAVNFTYQFLRKKFHILSQFLYDEHIKSRLLKDLQYWKEVKETKDSFPYSRALKFNKGIKSLGVSSKGISYLDQFRILVTHIGNAIGYIRLVRSGCLQCISSATQFLPDLQKASSISELCSDDLVNERTFEAARNLDEFIQNLTSHFEKETDYFKIMVDAFSSVLRDAKNAHLKNFFLILPAMTINYVEYFVSAKENVPKKYRDGSAFTDDGFAIGVTYILNVLDQNDSFASLRWWSGVRRNFIEEKEKVEMESSKAKLGDIKLQQTLSLTLSRLKECQESFEFLFLSISSAQVFFKRSTENTSERKG